MFWTPTMQGAGSWCAGSGTGCNEASDGASQCHDVADGDGDVRDGAEARRMMLADCRTPSLAATTAASLNLLSGDALGLSLGEAWPTRWLPSPRACCRAHPDRVTEAWRGGGRLGVGTEPGHTASCGVGATGGCAARCVRVSWQGECACAERCCKTCSKACSRPSSTACCEGCKDVWRGLCGDWLCSLVPKRPMSGTSRKTSSGEVSGVGRREPQSSCVTVQREPGLAAACGVGGRLSPSAAELQGGGPQGAELCSGSSGGRSQLAVRNTVSSSGR